MQASAGGILFGRDAYGKKGVICEGTASIEATFS